MSYYILEDRPMTQDAERLFLEAVELPPERRRIFLLENCSTEELRSEVESLLAGDGMAESFLESAVVEAAGSLQQATDQPPDPDIGPWRITSVLGRGGMGIVYAAQRSDGLFSQQVAIKVIQRRPDQASLVAGFERERRILAGLSHPNIARLFDGGTSSDGLPYLVMEHVDGVPISDYVRTHSLGVRQTVSLFLDVCSGVEHAHRHFIVHRDIKPGNILVAADGVVKLLDFGVARMMSDDGQSTHTQTLAVTLEYASPEQVRGEQATTATDVYSLGGVLYQLLTGATPLQLGQVPLEECLRAIVERAPRNPLDLRPAIGRDLSYIVLRALRKEPDRRYPSVEALRLDLERYLKGLPVEARGNSPAYLAGRYFRRRWLPLTAAMLVFASTVTGLVLSRRAQARAEYQSQVAEQARQTAESERQKAEDERRKAEDQRQKAEESGREAGRQKVLADERAASLSQQFVRSHRNLTLMFDRQFAAGRFREALTALDQWLPLEREQYGAEPDNQHEQLLLGILEGRHCTLVAQDNPLAAATSCQESIRLLTALFHTPWDDKWLRVESALAESILAQIRTQSGKAEEGIVLYRRGLDDIQGIYRMNPGDIDARHTEAALRLGLAGALVRMNRMEEAIRMGGESYRILRDLGSPTEDGMKYMAVGLFGVNFSKILAQKNPGRAERLMEDSLGMLHLAANSPKSGVLEWNEYANALNECPYPRLHNMADAVTFAKRAAEASRNSTPAALDTLAWAYYYAGDRAQALETERQALSMTPPDSPLGVIIQKGLSQFEKQP
jgi:tetratricopeptide (TPR) repeat protein